LTGGQQDGVMVESGDTEVSVGGRELLQQGFLKRVGTSAKMGMGRRIWEDCGGGKGGYTVGGGSLLYTQQKPCQQPTTFAYPGRWV